MFKNLDSGDCDNLATFETALLRYAGFEDKDITYVSGRFEYRHKELTGSVQHAAIIVNVDEQPYLLDTFIYQDGPVALDKNLKGTGQTSLVEVDNQKLAVDVQIKTPTWFFPVDPAQNAFVVLNEEDQKRWKMPEENKPAFNTDQPFSIP